MPKYSDIDNKLKEDETGGIAIVSDIDAIKQSVENILGTQKGEMPMNPDFGYTFEESLFEFNDAITEASLLTDMQKEIEKWDSRPKIQSVFVRRDPDSEQVWIDLTITTADFGSAQVTIPIR